MNAELRRRKALEDALRVVGAVVVPDPCVIAAHDEVSATVVLAHQRVEHGLPRAGVPHRGREAGEQHAIPRVVPLQQHAVALDADGGRDVVVLGGPEEWVQQQPVDRLESRLLDVLVRPVHRIPRLKADHGAPAALGKRASGVRGIERQLRERRGGAPE